MREDRLRGAERAIERDLLRRVGDVIVAADDVGDLHGDVVGHDRHVVDRRPVAPQDDEVVEVVALEADAAVDRVVPGDFPLGDAEADDRWGARGQAARGLLGWKPAAAAVVAERRALGQRLPLGVELFGGAEAAIRLAAREQPLGVGAMAVGVRALEERTFVPVEPEPGESVEDDLGMGVAAAFLVGVFDAQDEDPARSCGRGAS